MWIPRGACPNKHLLYLGVVDALIVLALIIATSIETSFVGKTKQQCAQLSSNGTAVPFQTRIFFERAGAIEKLKTPEALCKEYLNTFYIGIAMIILYGLSALSNIIIGAHSWRGKVYDYETETTRTDRQCLYAVFILPFSFIWALIEGILLSIISCLPIRMQRPILFFMRYVRKWGHHKKASADIMLRRIPRRIPNTLLKRKKKGERILANALIYDIVVLIAPNLHYVDLVNLSAVSKLIRTTLFPPGEVRIRQEKLRLYSCHGNEKSECRACGIQLCKECGALRDCRTTSMFFHMQQCKAQCSKCFYSSINNPYDQCHCLATRRTDLSLYSRWQPTDRRRYFNLLLCRDCDKMNDRDLLALKNIRDYRLTAE